MVDVKGHKMEGLPNFCSQVKLRSEENQGAFSLLLDHGYFGVAVGLLRQELDSLIRVSYLWREDIKVLEGERLIKDAVEGKQWEVVTPKGKPIRLTDREMLKLANYLGGWEGIVYDFGCKFIHLSNYHLYQAVDPLQSIKPEEKKSLILYLKRYHDYPHNEISFALVKPYLPKVMQKISENIEFFLEELLKKYDPSR